jgi:hypothetical protein
VLNFSEINSVAINDFIPTFKIWVIDIVQQNKYTNAVSVVDKYYKFSQVIDNQKTNSIRTDISQSVNIREERTRHSNITTPNISVKEVVND